MAKCNTIHNKRNYNFVWAIDNFPLFHEMGNKIAAGNYYKIKSCKFSSEDCNNIKFYMIIMMKKGESGTIRWEFIFDECVAHPIEITLSIPCINYHVKIPVDNRYSTITAYNIGISDHSGGIDLSSLLSTLQLQNETTLTINCDVAVCTLFTWRVDVAPSQLQTDYEKLYESQEFTDFIFIVGDKEFPIHKLIVKSRNRVFDAMLTLELAEKMENRATIPDIHPEVFGKLLEFIYTDRVKYIGEYAMDLLIAAEKYEMEDLKKFCEDTISCSINVNNATTILILAHQHNAKNLICIVENFINKNRKEVCKARNFDEIKKFPEWMSIFFKLQTHWSNYSGINLSRNNISERQKDFILIIETKSHFTWKIRNFSEILKLYNRDSDVLKSSVFSTKDGSQWFFKIILENEISVQLELESSVNGQESAYYSVCVVGLNNELLQSKRVEIHRYYSRSTAPKCELFSRDKNSHLLVNDCLTIRCDLTVAICELEHRMKELKARNLHQDIAVTAADYAKLWHQNKDDADWTFLMGTKEFRVHKIILISRWAEFRSMLDESKKVTPSENKENSTTVITDMDADVFAKLLEFIYTDQVTNIDEVALGLLAVAEKYQLERLKNFCEEAIFNNINVMDAANILIVAQRYNAKQLFNLTAHFIYGNKEEVIKTTGFMELEKNNCDLLFELLQVEKQL